MNWKKARSVICSARGTTLNAAGHSGCSDTVLVDAAAGLISSTPVMMAPVVWLSGKCLGAICSGNVEEARKLMTDHVVQAIQGQSRKAACGPSKP